MTQEHPVEHPVEKPTWLEDLPQRPLCDIPWLGRVVVLSSGAVNFCCSSNAVVGDVNQESLAAIWVGETMQQIRRALAAQTLPPQCRSTACPIYRGDDATYLRQRMDGYLRPAAFERRQRLRAQLAGARLLGPERAAPGEDFAVDFVLPELGEGARVDAFVALTAPDGCIRFGVEGTDHPLPSLRHEWIGGAATTLTGARVRVPLDGLTGTWTCCAALFAFDSSPAALANCLWSSRFPLRVAPS